MNIIINGGTKGIGREIALLLSNDDKNRILVTGRTEMSLKKLASQSMSGNIATFTLDLARFDNQKEIFLEAVKTEFKAVDILINMAGMLIVRDFMKCSEQESREMMEVNFFGPAAVIKVLKPLMKKGSHIVNISSMGGFQGSSKYRGLSYYSASKAAISCLSECLAGEFSESGIIVNSLALGAVQTEMFEKAFPGSKAPVKPKEMAELIVDFAINGSKFYNGKVLPVAIGNP